MNDTDNHTKDGAASLTIYKLTVNLLTSLFWPAVTLFIFLCLKDPLLKIIQQLPEILSQSTHVSVGGVSVDVQRRLKLDAPKDLQTALSGLPADCLITLLDTKGTFRYLSSDWEKSGGRYADVINELKKRNLITIENTQQGEAYPLRAVPTDLGNRANEFVYRVLLDQLLAEPTPNPR